MGGRDRRQHRGGGAGIRLITTPITLLGLVCTVIGLLAGCGSEPDTATPSTPQQIPLTAPPTDLRWVEFNGMRLPQAAEGPHEMSDVIAPGGFDRTPPGAGLAAVNAIVRLSVALDDQWPQVVRELLAPGQARDDFITNRIQLSTTSGVPAGQAPQVQGWKLTAFTPDKASVDIYTRLPDRSMTVNHTTVVWAPAFGDWRLLLPDAAAGASPVDAISATPTDMVALTGA
ncbi:hypothetical protein [Gordonia sp. UCD-TK1]|uniref:hypothetical protein n=1 Tax=Gordonia sp. UCD-TK1 TaxID=1857893 RepID=UPI00111215A9|nr:hypothetical protein [Gordonia sp. UCD-TK1]